MPPIQLHTNSPINAAKAEGITPKTAAPSDDETDGGSNNLPVQNQIHAPLHYPTPTKTTTSTGLANDNKSPPPPQPGAVPSVSYPQLTQAAAAASSASSYAPPAPAPTQAAQLPGGRQYTYPTPTQPPPQMGMSLLERTAPHTYRGTSTAATPSTGATTAAAPSTGISSDGSRQAGYGTAENYVGVGGGRGYVGYSPPTGGYQPRGNANANGSYQDDGEEQGVWNSAVKWAQVAGEKLSAAESEVWRRINKE